MTRSARSSSPCAARTRTRRCIGSRTCSMRARTRASSCAGCVILAGEDIGLADPMALVVASAAAQAFEFVGMPEGHISDRRGDAVPGDRAQIQQRRVVLPRAQAGGRRRQSPGATDIFKTRPATGARSVTAKAISILTSSRVTGRRRTICRTRSRACRFTSRVIRALKFRRPSGWLAGERRDSRRCASSRRKGRI